MLVYVSNFITTIVCLIAAFIIQRVYLKERKRDYTPSVMGIKWFALAILSWGLGALLNLVFIIIFELEATHKLIIISGVFFSLLNSLFILLSIPSIEHNQSRNLVIRIIERFSNKDVFILFGGILTMITSVFLLSLFTSNQKATYNSIIWLIDIPISIVVAFALLHELNKAFANRDMKFMYLPTFCLFFLIIVAVTHRIVPTAFIENSIAVHSWNTIGVVSSLSFKLLFILLFTILLYSWKLLAENEEQQNAFKILKTLNNSLQTDKEALMIANESHIDTIKHLKTDLIILNKKHQQLIKDSEVELSKRQKEVLANLAHCGEQKSYTDIAHLMHISLDGFQAHIHQIKKVLNISGIKGKEELMAYAIKNNLLHLSTITCN